MFRCDGWQAAQFLSMSILDHAVDKGTIKESQVSSTLDIVVGPRQIVRFWPLARSEGFMIIQGTANGGPECIVDLFLQLFVSHY